MDTMVGPVAADIACLAVVGGCHASSICVPYEDHSTGASSVTVRILKITQDPPTMLLRGERAHLVACFGFYRCSALVPEGLAAELRSAAWAAYVLHYSMEIWSAAVAAAAAAVAQ